MNAKDKMTLARVMNGALKLRLYRKPYLVVEIVRRGERWVGTSTEASVERLLAEGALHENEDCSIVLGEPS